MEESRDLVERTMRGDVRAANALLTRFAALAYTTALRLTADPEESEDIAQEALLRAHARLAELRDPALFGPWLRRMTANIAVTRLRRRGRIRFDSLDRHVFDESGDEREHGLRDETVPTPEEAVIRLLDARSIQTLLARLPIEQRIAVVLRDVWIRNDGSGRTRAL